LSGEISPKLVSWFANTAGQRYFNSEAKQTTNLASINLSKLSAFSIPISPATEQRRLVDAIDEHFSRLDAAVAELERVRANLKRYRAAVLKAACEGRLVPTEAELARAEGRQYESGEALLTRILTERDSLPESARLMRAHRAPKFSERISPDLDSLPKLQEGWCWASMAQLGLIQGGIQKQPSRAPQCNAYPFLRVANVLRGSLDLTEMHQVELFQGELDRLKLETADLLIVEGNGNPTEIGRMAIWNGTISDCVHQNHIIRVRPVQGILAEYIQAYWNSPGGSIRVTGVSSSTSGLHTLSVAKVASIPIPVPPLAEQERIVAEVERRLSVVDELQATVGAGLRRAARLRQAILNPTSAGFSG